MFIQSFAKKINLKFNSGEQPICQVIAEKTHFHFTIQKIQTVQITKNFTQNTSTAITIRPIQAWKRDQTTEDLKKMEEKRKEMLHALLCTVTKYNITTRALQAYLHIVDSSIKA